MPGRKQMGHDLVIKDTCGNTVTSIFRCCSGNWYAMWHKYNVSPYIWHGHRGHTILHNINLAIEKVTKDGAQHIEPGDNPDFYWGVRNGVMMTDKELLDTFYAWLRLHRSFAERYRECRWFSNLGHQPKKGGGIAS
jgi:hypothetical protein